MPKRFLQFGTDWHVGLLLGRGPLGTKPMARGEDKQKTTLYYQEEEKYTIVSCYMNIVVHPFLVRAPDKHAPGSSHFFARQAALVALLEESELMAAAAGATNDDVVLQARFRRTLP